MKNIFVLSLFISLGTVTSAMAEEDPFDDFDDVETEEVSVATDGPKQWFAEGRYPVVERGISLPFAATARRNSLRFFIDHRSSVPLFDSPFEDFLGLDAALNVGLGLRFAVWDGLDLGIYRLRPQVNGVAPFDVYQFDVKYQFLSHDKMFVDVAAAGGLTWYSQEDLEDAAGGFAQLLISKQIGRLTLGTGLLYHSDSTAPGKTVLDEDYTLSTFAAAELRVFSWLALNLESAVAFAGYTGFDSDSVDTHPTLAFSTKFITSRHTFALVISNTEYTSADSYLTNSVRSLEDVIFGFSITREWNLGGN